ncbi:hypothetical protein NNX39_00820 [Arthrobacter sp. zg-Y826]|uniref:hypothetical protein n=1 Tax=Arthrobacter jinronghuae TaxID=2964609 RepID=UPI0021031BC9|nr:hypothetical protein [Arthrobacter jinronghuae]MCQ1955046.1 hypothetical protein [Arthrobacter jinronghuae]
MRRGGEGGTRQAGKARQVPDEGGSAVVEFIFLGLILLVPVVYLVVTVGQIQGASFAVVGAADAAAKVYAAAPDTVVGEQQAADAAELALSDFGLQADGLLMDISCSEVCLAPGSTVTVSVQFAVPLPGLPWTDGSPVVVDSQSTQVVERFG